MDTSPPAAASAPAHAASGLPPSPGRVFAGGVLMGLANLVPGVSGGTMILALGLYDRFIAALADFTRLAWSRRILAFLVILGTGAVLAIGGFSTLLVTLVVEHRWIMYSLFVGMTLGGVPELARESRPVGPAVVAALLAGLGGMIAFAFLVSPTDIPHNAVVFAGVGALAASSMILPGVSGSLVLLVFGLYEVVVGSVRPSALMEDPAGSLRVLVPVAVGAAAGVGLLANVLKTMLARWPAPSHGLLLGFLLGSALVLVPFQAPVDAALARKPYRKAVTALVVDGAAPEEVRAASGLALDDVEIARIRAEYGALDANALRLRADELRYFRPTLLQVLASIGLFVLGLFATRVLQTKERRPPS